MKEHPSSDEKDPFHDLKEWQDHRYDPGYFLGGRIHPLLKARRPNKYGYVLIFSGLAALVFALFASDYGPEIVLQLAFAILLIAAGARLVKGADARSSYVGK